MYTPEIRRIIRFQEMISNLSEKTIVDTRVLILTSLFAQSTHGVKFIVKEICLIAYLRPFKYNMYADFLKSIYDNRGENKYLDLIPLLVKERFSSSIYRFFYRCISNGLVNIDVVLNKISGTFDEEEVFMIVFFSILIKKYEPVKYRKLREKILSIDFEGFQLSLKKILRRFKDYEANDFKLLRPLIEYGWPKSSLQYHLALDDINFLVNYSTRKDFNINRKVQYTQKKNRFALEFGENSSIIEYCCLYGSLKCFKYLLLNDVELTQYTQSYAFASGNNEMIHILEEKNIGLEKGLTRSIIFRRNPLYFYAFQRVHQRQQNINFIFQKASEYENLEVLLHIMSGNADYNVKRLADNIMGFDSLDLVKMLYEKGCNMRKISTLISAARTGNVEIVKFLIEKNPPYTFKEGTDEVPMNPAVKSHNIETVRYLLDQGFDPNVLGKNNNALHIACKIPDLEMVKILVMSGANINIPNRKGELPVEIAMKNKGEDIVEYLLEKGAKKNINEEEDDLDFASLMY